MLAYIYKNHLVKDVRCVAPVVILALALFTENSLTVEKPLHPVRALNYCVPRCLQVHSLSGTHIFTLVHPTLKSKARMSPHFSGTLQPEQASVQHPVGSISGYGSLQYNP